MTETTQRKAGWAPGLLGRGMYRGAWLEKFGCRTWCSGCMLEQASKKGSCKGQATDKSTPCKSMRARLSPDSDTAHTSQKVISSRSWVVPSQQQQ